MEYLINLTKIRERKGLSKVQLAAKANLSATYIGELEALSKSPTLRMAQRVANALGCTIEDLAKGG